MRGLICPSTTAAYISSTSKVCGQTATCAEFGAPLGSAHNRANFAMPSRAKYLMCSHSPALKVDYHLRPFSPPTKATDVCFQQLEHQGAPVASHVCLAYNLAGHLPASELGALRLIGP